MRLISVEYDLINQALTLVSVLNTGEHAPHSNIVGFQLCDHILPQTPRTEAYTVAEVTDPATIVLTHIEVVIVAELETSVAKLAIAAILGLLRKFKVSLQIDRRFFMVKF